MRAGSALVDVTPEERVPLAGLGPDDRFSTGVRDPIHARSLVLEGATTTVAIVSLDLLWVSRELVTSVCNRLEAAGIPVDDVLLSATHTHDAPWLPVSIDDHEAGLEFHGETSGFTRENAAPFTDDLDAAIARAIEEAYEARRKATLRVGRANNDTVGLNRRSRGGIDPDPPGGLLDEVTFPKRVRRERDADADVDPELLVLLIESDEEEILVVNYAIHTNTLHGTDISADFPGELCARIADARDARALFINGAAGDVMAHRNWDWEAYDSGGNFTEAMGEAVAETALEAADDAETLDPIEDPVISSERRELDLPVRSVDSTVVRNALENRRDAIAEEIDRDGPRYENQLTQPDAGSKVREKVYIDRLLKLDRWSRDRLVAPLHHARIGPVSVLSLPFETFVDHGLDFKRAARADSVVVAGYTNGYLGYFPTAEEFDYGGYEVETSPFTATAVEKLRREVFAMIS